uniref:(northern house mosquito) hypothetical protein n=1 Tax=Culex pipiens TaxID=7175 RepID=A0A8D8G5G9_CULPI
MRPRSISTQRVRCCTNTSWCRQTGTGPLPWNWLNSSLASVILTMPWTTEQQQFPSDSRNWPSSEETGEQFTTALQHRSAHRLPGNLRQETLLDRSISRLFSDQHGETPALPDPVPNYHAEKPPRLQPSTSCQKCTYSSA